MIYLEVIITDATIEISHRRHTMGQTIEICDGNTGGIIQVAITAIRYLSNDSNVDVIVAAAELNDSGYRRIFRHHCIVTTEGSDNQTVGILEG